MQSPHAQFRVLVEDMVQMCQPRKGFVSSGSSMLGRVFTMIRVSLLLFGNLLICWQDLLLDKISPQHALGQQGGPHRKKRADGARSAYPSVCVNHDDDSFVCDEESESTGRDSGREGNSNPVSGD